MQGPRGLVGLQGEESRGQVAGGRRPVGLAREDDGAGAWLGS